MQRWPGISETEVTCDAEVVSRNWKLVVVRRECGTSAVEQGVEGEMQWGKLQ